MAFQEIDPVDSAEFYLDMAFKKCTKRSSFKKVPKRSTKFDKIKTLEISKVDSFHGILVSKLTSIVEMFPKLDDLTDFYVELVKITLGIREYKHALYNVSWSSKKLDSFFSGYIGRLKGAKNLSSLHKVKNEFFGRCSSVMKSLKKDFLFLAKARISLQSFPVIRQRLKQVAIAGFPNVGKSTLLSKLSASKPEIASYPFTTKKTMIGYVSKNNVKTTQLLDTPGTLNRADKMNFIEQQAYLIMKMVAEKIIFVFDLTEPYPLEDQIKLYKRIKLLKKPMIVYLSKTDILKKDKYAEFKKEFSAVSDFNDLKNFI